MADDATLGERIKAARAFAGNMSRDQLAAAIGVSGETIGRYERDEVSGA